LPRRGLYPFDRDVRSLWATRFITREGRKNTMIHHRLADYIIAPLKGMLALGLASTGLLAQTDVTQTNLVSDIPGEAEHTDPNLVNPWGIAESAGSPFWIADNGTGLSTLYTTTGTTIPLVVTIPNPSGGTSGPDGAVFNGNGLAFNGDAFLFASEDGAITGWRGALGTNAEILLNGTSANSVFKGLAISNIGSNTYLYATDFRNNQITVLPSAGAPALTGTFTDPSLPAGFAAFGIQNINGELYVSYAKQDAAKHDDVAGLGNGYIDVFSLNGDFIRRLVSNGPLDSPWGMTLAPVGFGTLGGDLLVGNFGDGTIEAFNATTGAFISQLDDSHGNPLVDLGLWGLHFGNGGNGGLADTLYFTAGIPGNGAVEDHGLFGSLSPIPDGVGSGWLVGAAGLVLLGASRRRSLARCREA
jgi:uncharacterized protein (TIGR03118 family)